MKPMRCFPLLFHLVFVVGMTFALNAELTAADQEAALVHPLGKPQTLQIDTGRSLEGRFALTTLDARQQLVVTGMYAGGESRDLTRSVIYEVTPAAVAQVTKDGMVVPLSAGAATIAARTAEGISTTEELIVTRSAEGAMVDFDAQVQPILTKSGCNSGSCHGKAGGQKGFQLSLHGFDSQEDYDGLTKAGRGRRIFPSAPDQSMILRKATATIPHNGGVRLPMDSPSYRLLRRWIEQGLPFHNPEIPTLSRIEIFPRTRIVSQHGEQQVLVVGHYSDGSTEDITTLTQFETNSREMAEVSGSGLVSFFDQPGDVAVMGRYQGEVAIFQASIPLGARVDNLPEPKNFLDSLVFKKLKTLGLPPSETCDDSTFVRRTAIDIAGRLPTLAETEQFLSDSDPQKREKWIDSLLASGDYADNFARKWTVLLRNKREGVTDARGSLSLHAWVRDLMYANKPYDQFVHELLTASGDIEDSPAVNWWRNVKANTDQVENSAQILLGLRIACAQCHHHPFDKWGQDDYFGYAAFFSRVGRKFGLEYASNVERIYYDRGLASVKHPKTDAVILPKVLGGKPLEISLEDDPRQVLADWITAGDNPYFARALVNRYWKHFLGRGLVEPEDDMRSTNPASNPELLDALARHFQESRYDLQDLVRTICTSRVYQLSSQPNSDNINDKQNFARFYPRRMMAEVLLDSIDSVAMSRSYLGGAPGLPAETRAVQLPHDPYPGMYFLEIFGMPDMTTACECERSSSANLSQSLHLFNSADIRGKVSSPTGRGAVLAADKDKTPEQKIRELFLLAYSRPPTDHQLEVAAGQLAKSKDEKAALENILWALLNTKEFIFNH